MSRIRSWFLCILTLWALGSACDEEPLPRATVAVTVEINHYWDLLPHRLSLLEALFEETAGATGGTLSVRNNGGSFGIIDTPNLRFGLTVWRSRQLVAEAGSIEVEIPPGSEEEGEPFSRAAVAVLPAGPLVDATPLVAFVRGYAISTDEYETPPPFETDPVLPYDPGDGFTSQGISIGLGVPVVSETDVSVPVRVANRLGLSDRGDMNAAIPQASSWMRVDFVVVGVRPGAGGVLTLGSTDYFLGFAEYGTQTVHTHSEEGEQRVSLPGAPGISQALFGITGFDLWLNTTSHPVWSCEVVQDATNSWDEPISGPGRYVTELSVRLWNPSYDVASGLGVVRLDLFLSNTSQYKEVGNICLAVQGEAAMLQFEDPEAERIDLPPVEVRFDPEGAGTEEVVY